MSALSNYIDGKNSWRQIMNKADPSTVRPLIDIDSLDQETVEYLALNLSCDLSPENLTCDGELSPDEANEKEQELLRATQELFQYALANNFICNVDV